MIKTWKDYRPRRLNQNVGSTVLQTCHITLTLCAYDMAVISGMVAELREGCYSTDRSLRLHFNIFMSETAGCLYRPSRQFQVMFVATKNWYLILILISRYFPNPNQVAFAPKDNQTITRLKIKPKEI